MNLREILLDLETDLINDSSVPKEYVKRLREILNNLTDKNERSWGDGE